MSKPVTRDAAPGRTLRLLTPRPRTAAERPAPPIDPDVLRNARRILTRPDSWVGQCSARAGWMRGLR